MPISARRITLEQKYGKSAGHHVRRFSFEKAVERLVSVQARIQRVAHAISQ